MTSTTEDIPALMQEPDFMLGFVGAGNMAQAILRSLLAAGTVRADQVLVTAPSDTRLAPLRKQGVHTTHCNTDVLRRCQVVLLCVKPHIFTAAVESWSQVEDYKTQLVISVMAGLTLDFMKEHLAMKVGIFRAMPNTPCFVGQGCCVYALDCSDLLAATGRRLLSCLGLVRQIPETQINAAAAVAGSGPAYLYLVIEALADGGVKMGLPRELAMALSAQTVRGAACLVQDSGKHPGQLKDEVCSPGGTTIAGMHALERAGVRAGFMDAVEAATVRAGELLQKQQAATSQSKPN